MDRKVLRNYIRLCKSNNLSSILVKNKTRNQLGPEEQEVFNSLNNYFGNKTQKELINLYLGYDMSVGGGPFGAAFKIGKLAAKVGPKFAKMGKVASKVGRSATRMGSKVGKFAKTGMSKIKPMASKMRQLSNKGMTGIKRVINNPMVSNVMNDTMNNMMSNNTSEEYSDNSMNEGQVMSNVSPTRSGNFMTNMMGNMMQSPSMQNLKSQSKQFVKQAGTSFNKAALKQIMDQLNMQLKTIISEFTPQIQMYYNKITKN